MIKQECPGRDASALSTSSVVSIDHDDDQVRPQTSQRAITSRSKRAIIGSAGSLIASLSVPTKVIAKHEVPLAFCSRTLSLHPVGVNFIHIRMDILCLLALSFGNRIKPRPSMRLISKGPFQLSA